jgi:Asp-tRNA(Asn)/Glu-tRNA(Gln) amidotransferase A subunit family amidase
VQLVAAPWREDAVFRAAAALEAAGVAVSARPGVMG